MAAGLRKAGFEVRTAADPTRSELSAALKEMAERSKDAEAAVIYLTGHGFEHDDQVYLAPNDYPFEEGPEQLSKLAVRVSSLVDFLKARTANLVFYGGCRTHW